MTGFQKSNHSIAGDENTLAVTDVLNAARMDHLIHPVAANMEEFPGVPHCEHQGYIVIHGESLLIQGP